MYIFASVKIYVMEESLKELVKRPPRRKFHTIRAKPGVFQVDIAFLKYGDSKKYRKENQGHSCLLMAVEIATRRAYISAMKGKSAAEVLDAFERILTGIERDGTVVTAITTDEGSEFHNAQWDRFLASQIPPIVQHRKEALDRFSLGIIDRFTRTIKEMIEDYQITNNTLDWYSALPGLVAQYNARTNNRLKASPNELNERGYKYQLARHIVENEGHPAEALFLKFKVGDHVRIRQEPGQKPRDNSRLSKPGKMSKGRSSWSNKVYVISEITGWSFRVVDLTGIAEGDRAKPAPPVKPMRQLYRAHDLLKVPATSLDVPDIWEGVAKEDRRERRRKKEAL